MSINKENNTVKVFEPEVVWMDGEEGTSNKVEKEKRVMKLLITKTSESPMEERDTLIEVLVSVMAVVRKWISKGVINGVIDEDNEEIKLEESDIVD